MRKAPRFIIAAIVLMFVGWGGFWFVGSTATQKLLSRWFEARQGEGWTASYDSLNTAGFPSRFDTTITNLTLADPRSGLGWSAPLFQILSLSYQPTNVIAVFPGEQIFASQGTSHKITSDLFRASASFTPSADLAILRSVTEIDGARITSSDGLDMGFEHTQLSMRETPERQGDVYDFDVTVQNIMPDAAFMRRINRQGAFSDTVEQVKVSATVRFDAPWDRFALERKRPQPREIELTKLTAKWGPLVLKMDGVLTVDRAGQPEGDMTVEAKNWREMVAVAQASGALPAAFVGTVTRAGEMLARMSGSPNTLNADLTFKNGRVFLGPIPLGPAPIIKLQ